MKLTDYLVKYLESLNIKKAFGITGSAIAPLFDSFNNIKKIKLICTQHEQAAAMAADAYARVSKNIGLAISTSGPGATNLITGICCAWYDSIPCLFITGQVNSRFTKGDLPIKQIGFQETDIVSIVKPVTKYAVMVKDPKMIRYELEKAVYIAKNGRPGPVLIDLPMDIQNAQINEKSLLPYDKAEKIVQEDRESIKEKIENYIKDLQKAKRPVILVGGGVKHSHAIQELRVLLKKLKIPLVLTWAALDVVEDVFPLYRGRIGTYGQRGANFTFQNADLLLSLGSRHDGRQTGGRVDSFAREAKRYIVDVDNNELKYQQVKGHVNINCDLKDFIHIFLQELSSASLPIFTQWLKQTKTWQEKYPIVTPDYKKPNGRINGYAFMELLSELAQENDVIIGDCGGNIAQLAQAFKVKRGQQVISSWAHSPMGYSMAAAIGAYFGRERKNSNVICTIGDGGMQVNIHELQTLKEYKIPLKVFIINNESYGIIQQFQDIYHKSRYIAAVPGQGYSFPNFIKVAQAYGLATETITNFAEAKKKIRKVLDYQGPIICEVQTLKKTVLIPRLGWDTGIEDQYPYLDRKEFLSNLYIKPIQTFEKKNERNQP